MIVDLFIPCFIDQFYPDTAFSVVKVLEKLGVEINYNTKQTCCGQPSFNSGYIKETISLAEKFVNDFPENRYLVGPSASCLGFVRNHYEELLKDSKYLDKYLELKPRIFEFTDFIVNELKVIDTGSTFKGKVTYHDSCSALREYRLKDEPRLLLRNVKDLELIEMPESDVCCGFGGTFSVKHTAISTAMVEQKVENAISTGADYIVSTESSCLMNIESYIKKQGLKIKTIHIADILASGL